MTTTNMFLNFGGKWDSLQEPTSVHIPPYLVAMLIVAMYATASFNNFVTVKQENSTN